MARVVRAHQFGGPEALVEESVALFEIDSTIAVNILAVRHQREE